MPETGKATPVKYYAQDRWPVWDFSRIQPKEVLYQMVA
jgi:hypothetical protein